VSLSLPRVFMLDRRMIVTTTWLGRNWQCKRA